MTEAHLPNQVHPRGQTFVHQYAVALFCTITVLITIAIVFLPLPPLIAPMLVVFVPTLVAIFLIVQTDGWQQVRPSLFGASKWRAGIKWVFISLIVALALRLFTSLFALALGYPFNPQGFTPFLFMLIPFAAGEEIGWRGYALPLALKRFSPLAAAVLLGIPWGLLHIPLTLPGKMSEGAPVVAMLLMLLSLSILTTWVYLSAGRSLLTPVLIHGGQNFLVFMNSGIPVEPLNWSMAVIYSVTALIVILLTRGKLQSRSQAERGNGSI